MSPGALKLLKVENLRGCVSPFPMAFEKGKKLTVVYGENGTGKSTICDSLEFLAKGMVGSIEGRGLGAGFRAFWPTLGRTLGEISVTLESSSGTCQATMRGNDVIVNPPDQRPRVEVLRRAQILSLLEETPSKRYEAIRRFVDVSGVEGSEAALRQAIKNLDAGRNAAAMRINENHQAVLNLWKASGAPGTDGLTWARSEAVRDPGAADAECRALEQLRASYARFAELAEKHQEAIAGEAAARAEHAAARAQVEARAEQAADGAGEILQLLEAADTYISRFPEPGVCPVCESGERATGLGERVAARIRVFTELQNAQAEERKRRATLGAAEQRSGTRRSEALQSTGAFERARSAAALPDGTVVPAPIPDDPELWSEWIRSAAVLPEGWRTAETERAAAHKLRDALKRSLGTFDENMEGQKELDRILPKMRRALEISEERRRAFTDDLLAEIANSVGELYEQVHPGEGLNAIRLKLDPRKRSSLEIGVKFGTKADAPPGAYFSDSHLDTLGLCVFIALAARDSAKETILVLDDVLGSVDEPHVDRLIEMLYGVAAEFRHCVITTHYGPWKHKLRWGWLKNGQVQFVELTRWDAARGVALVRSIPDLERLEMLLAEPVPDPQLVTAKAGVILEAALDFLTLHYQCSVPRKLGGDYTLGDLLPAVNRDLRKVLRVEVVEHRDDGTPSYRSYDLGKTLDELTRIAQARNVIGCHFNQIAFDLLDSDAIVFGQLVLEMMRNLTDTVNGWPKNGKSGSYHATAGETRRLHPFKRPG